MFTNNSPEALTPFSWSPASPSPAAPAGHIAVPPMCCFPLSQHALGQETARWLRISLHPLQRKQTTKYKKSIEKYVVGPSVGYIPRLCGCSVWFPTSSPESSDLAIIYSSLGVCAGLDELRLEICCKESLSKICIIIICHM